ncbi:hypothetical protein DH2020_000058 [Rehmannia glutinosa]|uniref:Uncharacterized protein n=1 Tax=Rehmannia glutinosa TaxID=99300 RepID=A0ABR0XVQ6_REHGL
MASLNFFLSPIVTPQKRVIRTAATAAKTSGGGSTEEKGLLDFILGGLTKQDQFYETDPILKKVEEKSGGTTSATRKNTAAPPPPQPKKKDNGGLGLDEEGDRILSEDGDQKKDGLLKIGLKSSVGLGD